MVLYPHTAQSKLFPYFLIESASGSGKTRFAAELFEWLRKERSEAQAVAKAIHRSQSVATTTDDEMSDAAGAAATCSATVAVLPTNPVYHIFPQSIVMQSSAYNPHW